MWLCYRRNNKAGVGKGFICWLWPGLAQAGGQWTHPGSPVLRARPGSSLSCCCPPAQAAPSFSSQLSPKPSSPRRPSPTAALSDFPALAIYARQFSSNYIHKGLSPMRTRVTEKHEARRVAGTCP